MVRHALKSLVDPSPWTRALRWPSVFASARPPPTFVVAQVSLRSATPLAELSHASILTLTFRAGSTVAFKLSSTRRGGAQAYAGVRRAVGGRRTTTLGARGRGGEIVRRRVGSMDDNCHQQLFFVSTRLHNSSPGLSQPCPASAPSKGFGEFAELETGERKC